MKPSLGLCAGLAFWLGSWCSFSLPAATVGTFSGGDDGEGLDLRGNFLYAINIGPGGAAGQAGDADFLADSVTGLTVVSKAVVAPWGTPSYGDTPADEVIEKVMRSIRHMWPPPLSPMEVTLAGLEPGAEYKLQLLFVETCCQRAFDVLIDGELVVDEFAPVLEQGGLELQASTGVVITHSFTAANNQVKVVLDGNTVTSPDYSDLNPILAGLTLERISAVGDKDTDGLPDDWEQKFFGSLDQKANDDPDQDTLDNAAELARQTDPTKKDTDGDQLTDGAEINSHHTDPTKTDTDRDGLSDFQEIASHRTDPLKKDTDGDTYSDYDELRLITDPLNPESLPKKTTITLFSGGDPGEGLDLDGNFMYAINVGPPDPVGPIRDANFTEDTVEGVTISGGNIAGGWHPNPSFGDSLEDETLELLMSSIRWSSAGDPVTPTLRLSFANLEAGAAYKMQLLFAEEGWPRGFDATIDGRFVADDFSPMHYQGGYPKTNGVVLTHNFIASSNIVTVILDGRTVTLPEFTDHNPILQGATLELIAPNRDSDHDGLPDPWEIDQFNDLSPKADDDPDQDGLKNSTEFSAGTNPRQADTDGDGLDDGAELNTTKTNPLKSDTDADGLSDREEINVHQSDPNQVDTDGDTLPDGQEANVLHTSPTKADTDGDGQNDYDELRLMTDPADPASRSAFHPISVFTGGDPGEGLDLDGEFVYAINAGPPDPAGQIRDANFTEDTVEGVTLSSGNSAGGWHDPVFGDTESDLILALIMSSIRWSDAAAATSDVQLTLANLQTGYQYKLQLLFAEHGWPRGFDVYIDDKLILDDFSPAHYQGGYDKAKGVVVTHLFSARQPEVKVRLDGRGVTSPEITDHNALLQAATLEKLGVAPPPAPRIRGAQWTEGGFQITFESVAGVSYALQYQLKCEETAWQEMPATTATGSSCTLTDSNAARRSAIQGFWRVVVK